MLLMLRKAASRAPVQSSQSLIDSPQRRHIDSLPPDSSCTSNTGGVLTRSGVDDGIDDNLKGVFTGQKMDDLEGVFDNSACHELLAVIPAVHHEVVHQTLHNGALSLAETLGSVSSSRVGKILS